MTPETGAKISTMKFMLVGIVAEQPQMLGRGFHGYFGLVFGVLRDLQIVQCDGAVLVKILGALILSPGENLIRDRHFVSRIAAGDIVASNGHQQLAFLHGVAQPRVNRHDAAGGERDDGDVAGNVGRHRASNHQLGSRGMLGRRGERKLLRMIHSEEGWRPGTVQRWPQAAPRPPSGHRPFVRGPCCNPPERTLKQSR